MTCAEEAVQRLPLPELPDLLALQQAAPELFPGLLESAGCGGPRGRYDLLLATDGQCLCLDAAGRVHLPAGSTQATASFLDALDAWFAELAAATRQSDLPFCGGWLLYLGYELAAQIEPRLQLPTGTGLPVAKAIRCPVAIIVDHQSGTAEIVAEPGQGALLGRVRAVLAATPSMIARKLPIKRLSEAEPQRYLDGVARSLDYIRAGDVFQVNLSRAWQAELAEDRAPAEVYAALRLANPAPFSALVMLDSGTAVVSSSPERLVSRRGDRLETRPIAGTRPRLPGDDEAARVRELVGHPKERAEHIMLIDLERNDLGRVSLPGTVQVDELMAVESYAHVHHIESTVSGQARPDLTPGQLIRAVFPGGTITGCPKVRCMEIIAELEGEPRGPYTGAIGWLDRNGDLDLNILIRTLWMRGKSLNFRAGAGVVADSIAENELAETRAKARGLLRALGADVA